MTKIEVFHYTWVTLENGEDTPKRSTRKATRAQFENRKSLGLGLRYQLLEDTRELVYLGEVCEGEVIHADPGTRDTDRVEVPGERQTQ